jgi:hypothetical protein
MSTLTLQGTPFTRYPDPLVPPFSATGFSPNNVIKAAIVNVIDSTPLQFETRQVAAPDEISLLVFTSDLPASVSANIIYGGSPVYLGNVALGVDCTNQRLEAGSIGTSPDLFSGTVTEGQAVSPTGVPWVKGFPVKVSPCENYYTVAPSFDTPQQVSAGAMIVEIVAQNGVVCGRSIFESAIPSENVFPAFIALNTFLQFEEEIRTTGCISVSGGCLLICGVYSVQENRDFVQATVNGFTGGGGSQILLPIVGNYESDTVNIAPGDVVRIDGQGTAVTYNLPPIADVPAGKVFYIGSKPGTNVTLRPQSGEYMTGSMDQSYTASFFIVIKLDAAQAQQAFSINVPAGTESWALLMVSTFSG